MRYRFTIYLRRHAYFFIKCPVKCSEIIESYRKRDIDYLPVGLSKKGGGMVDPQIDNEVVHFFSRLFGKELAEIIRADVQVGGQTVAGYLRGEIFPDIRDGFFDFFN